MESVGARFRPATTRSQTDVGMPRQTFNMGQPRGPVTSPTSGFGLQPGGGAVGQGAVTPSSPSGGSRNRFRMM